MRTRIIIWPLGVVAVMLGAVALFSFLNWIAP